MSLLMDALKKAELAKRQGQGDATGDAGVQEAEAELSLQPMVGLNTAEPVSGLASASNLSPDALASHLEDIDTQFLAEAKEAATARLKAQVTTAAPALAIEPAAEQAAKQLRTTSSAETRRTSSDKASQQDKSAAQNLFAAKQIDKSSSRKTFAIAIGTVTVLSICGIGGYVWWQLQPKSPFVASRGPSAPVATPTPVAAPPAPTIAAPPSAPMAGTTSTPPAATPVANDKDDEEDAAPIVTKTSTPPRRNRPAPVAEPDPDSPVRVTKAPLKVNPALLRGFDAFNRGDMESAQLEYDRAQKSDPRNTDALHGLAAIAVRQGRHDQADLLYRQIIEADPQDSTAMSALINTRAQIDPGMAESRLKSLSAAQPDLAAPQFALGNVYARQGRWNEAQQAYFRAYGAEQDNPDILYNLAISLEHLRQNKLAVQYYTLAIAAAQGRTAGFNPAQAKERLQALQR